MAGSTVTARYYILGLLTQQPMSGYDIKHLFKSLRWLIGSPSFGSLYPTLRKLLKDNLVTVESVPRQDRQPRKIYSITEAGKQVLHKWLDEPSAPDGSLKAFIMRLILVSNFSHVALLAHLHQRRSQVAVQQALIEQLIETVDSNMDLGQRLTFDYSLSIAKAELAWLNRTLDQLRGPSLPVEVVQSDGAADIV